MHLLPLTQLSQLVEEIETQLAPFQEEQALLESIPGIEATTAAVIIAEIGVDMSVFPTASILPPGLESATAIAKVAASDSARRSQEATPICGPC